MLILLYLRILFLFAAAKVIEKDERRKYFMPHRFAFQFFLFNFAA